MEYWVIESNTRGILVDWDWASTGNSWGPRFKTSITRPEGMRFYSQALAQKELEKVTNGGINDLHGGKTRPVKGCYLTHIDTSGRKVGRCTCGSGLAKRDLVDSRGIFCTFVCDKCEQRKRQSFRPEIFTDPNYKHNEPIDEN